MAPRGHPTPSPQERHRLSADILESAAQLGHSGDFFFPLLHLKNLPGQSMRIPGAVAPPLRRLLPHGTFHPPRSLSGRGRGVRGAAPWFLWEACRRCHREIKPGCCQTWLVDGTSLRRWIQSHYLARSGAPGSRTSEAPRGC